ncbi:AraC family transcriptional regulator [Arachidicoccus ginsenosidivorans]|uniref:Helix-turn-helix transcriptional regulator n=1 Tax=Arachidicoccus ginsenosidivorans TaxID=496057 RepID=A0A5B8VNZ0_9BACT|nr:AraC family transcriptional regulator [Arachidicoccus ginsenosidivorans]QEC72622.1 helix-turn-helix transcriptional regulator [Arachidicoccus ginsenosidivorans]
MAERSEIIFDKLVYSCSFEKYRGDEQFIPDHFLGFQLSGETHAFYADGNSVIRENSVVLVKRNQLIRTIKYPSKTGKYQFLSITLDTDTLRRYAFENKVVLEDAKKTENKLFFKTDKFLNAYFLSLSPYINKTKKATPKLADLKIREAIELILQSDPDMKNVLFDFSEPYKIDLMEFMNQNYMFNVSVEVFARLAGRSVSGFKRDFAKQFHATPKQWLKDRRLEEAMYRIRQNQERPSDFYLDLGFENLSHFYYSFKQKFGITSSEI